MARMKQKKGYLLLAAFILAFNGACVNTTAIKRDLLKLKGRPVALPVELMVEVNRDSLNRYPDLEARELKLIHYISASECSICEIETFRFWEILLDSLRRNDIKPVIIIDPGLRYSVNQIKHSIKESYYSYPVYIDTGGFFYTTNPHIPENNIMHTFLVDKGNNVVIAGNPILNPNILELLETYKTDDNR